MSITKENGEKIMAEDAFEDRADEPKRLSGGNSPAVVPSQGFFHIYKSGQGYWTRMCTLAGGAALVLLLGNFLYTFLPTWSYTLAEHRPALIGIVLAVMAALCLGAFVIMNKPTNVDFLISTDSEMKKVNWTSRKELFGSTRIVVIFVVLITSILFLIDVIFGYVFYWLDVLKQRPF